jgi:putative RecB family exonuclease
LRRPLPTYVSYSQLDTYERCPRLFHQRYTGPRRKSWIEVLLFGTAVHGTLETLVGERLGGALAQELHEARVREVWNNEWQKSTLVGVSLYREGLDLVTEWVERQGPIEPGRVLSVEEKFELTVGRFTVIGAIDRIDKLDDETIEVIDYKTNRMLFSRDEVDESLQLSMYAIAAKKLYPWAKRVVLTYDMIRHGTRMMTERTEQQLDDVLTYVEMLAEQSRSAESFPARIGKFCGTCDERHECPGYIEAIYGRRKFPVADPADPVAVAKERQQADFIQKMARKRKDELDAMLKEHLKEHESIVADDVEFVIFNRERKRYPLGDTVETLQRASGKSRDEIISQVAVVENKGLEKFFGSLKGELDDSTMLILKAQVDANAKKTKSPTIWARRPR